MVKQFKMIGVMLGVLTFFLGQALGAAPLTNPSGQIDLDRLKGTLSEAELHILRRRMLEGKKAKARRGGLCMQLPMLTMDYTCGVVYRFLFFQIK